MDTTHVTLSRLTATCKASRKHPSVMVAFLVLLTIPLASQAALLPFEITFTNTSSLTFSGSFEVPEVDVMAKNLFVSVFDFTAEIHGITYASGDPASAPNPFIGLADYDAVSGALVGISTPFIGVPGLPSVFNFIMFQSGDWAVNSCVPLPSCSPEFDSGVYEIAGAAQVPEPASLSLILIGLIGGAWCRRWKPWRGC